MKEIGLDLLIENMKVSMILAERFNTVSNSIENIFTRIADDGFVDFCVFLAVSINERELLSDTFEKEDAYTLFRLSFYLAKMPSSENEGLSGFTFAHYEIGVGTHTERREDIAYIDSLYEKRIIVKQFQHMPLDGPGKYQVYVYLEDANIVNIDGVLNKSTILDGWQFEVY